MSRPKTTGRFETRRELLERVRFLWQDTSCNQATIARNCHVSDMTISKIIKEREWTKVEDWRVLDHGDMQLQKEPLFSEPLPMGEAITTIHQGSCGSGYMPDSCPLHLAPRFLNELEYME